MKPITKQSGFGIVEVMVAVVIGGVVMGSFAVMSKNMMETNAISNHKVAVADFQADVAESLKSSTACSETFAGLTFSNTSDIGPNAKKVPVVKIKQEGVTGTRDLADIKSQPHGFPLPGSPGGFLNAVFMSDFEVVDAAEGRYRARLKLGFDKHLSQDNKAPTGVREVPIFIKGTTAGSTVSLVSCSTSSLDWLSESDREQIASDVCKNSGGKYSTATGVCELAQVTAVTSKISVLERQLQELSSQISTLTSTVASLSSSPAPSSTPRAPSSTGSTSGGSSGPTSGTTTGGGDCNPPTSGKCAGSCGGGSDGCPNKWVFWGTGKSGGCNSGNTKRTTANVPGGVAGFICVKN